MLDISIVDEQIDNYIPHDEEEDNEDKEKAEGEHDEKEEGGCDFKLFFFDIFDKDGGQELVDYFL